MTTFFTHWWRIAGETPLEITATLSSVIGLVLIARQNALGWPLGILWSGISAWLAFFEWSLVSDGVLYLSYIPIQAYCWHSWTRPRKEGESLLPSWMDCRARSFLLVGALVGIAAWGGVVSLLAYGLQWIPEPRMLWPDATTTVLNYVSQWLQARKRMENWIGWLVVNCLGIVIYLSIGSPIYAFQYALFLILGLYGWWAWAQAMKAKPSS
jgi:nicotinamide mononucleotide transporter